MTPARPVLPVDHAAQTPDRRVGPQSDLEQAVERALVLAFAPLHKLYLGVAFGVAFATLLVLVTVVSLLRDPTDSVGLRVLDGYFYGYSVSWPGIFIGAAWAGAVGFVGGWFLAFSRNFVLATWLLYIRARATLRGTRDFLDHI